MLPASWTHALLCCGDGMRIHDCTADLCDLLGLQKVSIVGKPCVSLLGRPLCQVRCTRLLGHGSLAQPPLIIPGRNGSVYRVVASPAIDVQGGVAVPVVVERMIRQGPAETVTRGRKVWEAIREHCRKPELSRVFVADLLVIHPDTVTRALEAATGLTFNEAVTRQRIAGAAQDLEGTADPIYLIADRWGFGSASYFTRCFKERVGCTPRRFRRLCIL